MWAQVWFDRFILLIIIANCVTMALKDPLAPSTPGWSVVVEIVFTSIFTAEMLVKQLAMGVTPLESHACYISDGWNCLDGLIVILSYAVTGSKKRHELPASPAPPQFTTLTTLCLLCAAACLHQVGCL